MPELDYWLAFSSVKGVGAVRFRRLLAYFGALSRAWQASQAELMAAGLTEHMAAAIFEKQQTLEVEGLQNALAAKVFKCSHGRMKVTHVTSKRSTNRRQCSTFGAASCRRMTWQWLSSGRAA